MTALVKAKAEYRCLRNCNIYTSTKGAEKTCYHCDGECPRIVMCVSCGEEFPTGDTRRRVLAGMNPANMNRNKINRHQRTCAGCIDKANEVRLAETNRRNQNPTVAFGERWRIELVIGLYRADEVFGPTFGHQLLTESRILTIIDDEVISTRIDREDRSSRIVSDQRLACIGWENINTLLRQRS